MWSPKKGFELPNGKRLYPFAFDAEDKMKANWPDNYVCKYSYKVGNSDKVVTPQIPFPIPLSGNFHSAPLGLAEHNVAMSKYFIPSTIKDNPLFGESETYLHFHFDKYLVATPVLPVDDFNDMAEGSPGFGANRFADSKVEFMRKDQCRNWCLSKIDDVDYQEDIVAAFDKRELLPVEKQKPRIILPTAIISYLRDRRMLYWLVEKIKDFCPTHGIYIGSGIFNMDWHFRTIRMMKFKNAFGGDHKGYDTQCFAKALLICERYYMDCLDCDPMLKVQWLYFRNVMLKNYIIDRDGKVYTTWAKLMTGRFDTALTNSFRNVCIIFFLYNIIIKRSHPFWTLEKRMNYFEENCVWEVLGDDWNVSVSDELACIFNPKTVSLVGVEQGFIIDFSFINVVIPTCLPFCGVWTILRDGCFLPFADMVKMCDSFQLRIQSHVVDFDTLAAEFSKLCSLRILAYTNDYYWKIMEAHCLLYIHHFDRKYGNNPNWLKIRGNYIPERMVRKLYFSIESGELQSKVVALNECHFKKYTMPNNKGKKKQKGISPNALKVVNALKAAAKAEKSVALVKAKPKPSKPRVRRSNVGASTSSGGFSAVSAPTNVGTVINKRGRGKGINSEMVNFPFRECIGPNVQTNATTQTGGQLLYGDTAGVLQLCNWDMNPWNTDSFGTRLTNEAANWEYFEFTDLTLEWVPFQGSTTAGQIVIVYDYDPLNSPPPATTDGYRTFTQFANSKPGSVWREFGMRVDLAGFKYPVKKFFVDLNKAADLRQAVQGQVYLIAGGALPASTKFGQLWIRGNCRFTERVYRAGATGAGVQGTSAQLPTAGGVNLNSLQLTNATYSSQNPTLASVITAPDGSPAIFLAPGTYVADLSTTLSPSTSNSAGALQWGASALIPSGVNVTGDVATLVAKRADFSNVTVNANPQSFSASRQEIITSPFGGVYYRPLINNPAYVGTANPSTITINLSAIAASALSFVTSLFADPLEKRLYGDYVHKCMVDWMKDHSTMEGVTIMQYCDFIKAYNIKCGKPVRSVCHGEAIEKIFQLRGINSGTCSDEEYNSVLKMACEALQYENGSQLSYMVEKVCEKNNPANPDDEDSIEIESYQDYRARKIKEIELLKGKAVSSAAVVCQETGFASTPFFAKKK